MATTTTIPSPTHGSESTVDSGSSSSSSGLSIHVSAASPPKVNPSPRRASVMSARRQTFNNTDANNGGSILESAELRTKAAVPTSSSKPNSRRQTNTAPTNVTGGGGATLKATGANANTSSTSPWNSRPNSNYQRKPNQRAISDDGALDLSSAIPSAIVKTALANAGPITPPVAQGLWDALRCGHTRWSDFTTTECNYSLNAFSSVVRLTANEPIFTAGDFPSFFAVILAGGVVSSFDNSPTLATIHSPPTSPTSPTSLPEFLSATNVGTTGDIIGSEHFFSSQAHALLHAVTNHGEKPEAIKRLSQFDGAVLPSSVQPLFSTQEGKDFVISQLQSQIQGLADLSFMSNNGSASLLALHPVRPTTVVAASSGVTLALFSFEQVRSLLREADPITYGKLLAILAAENAQRTTQAQMAEGSMDRWWHCELEVPPVSPTAGPIAPPSFARQSSALTASPSNPAQQQAPTLGRTSSVVTATTKKASNMNSPPGPSARGLNSKISPAIRPKAEAAKVFKPVCAAVGCCAVPIVEEAIWSRITDRVQHQNELLAHIRAPNPRGSFAMGAEMMSQLLTHSTSNANLTPNGMNATSAVPSRRSSFTGADDANAPKLGNGSDSPFKVSPAKPPVAPSAAASSATPNATTSSSTTSSSSAPETWKKKFTNQAAQLAQLQSLLSESLTNEKYWKTAHQNVTSNLQEAQTRYDALKKQHDELVDTHKGCEKAVVDFVTLEKVLCSPFMTRMDAEQREAERVERLYALQAQQAQNGYVDSSAIGTPGSMDDGTSSGSRSVNRGSLPSNLTLNVGSNRASDSVLQLPAEGFEERDVLVSPVMHHDDSLDRPYSTFLATSLPPAQLSLERTKYSSRITYLMKKYSELKVLKKEHTTLKAQLNKLETNLSTTNVAKLDTEDSLARLTTQLHNVNRTLEFTLKLNMGYKVDIANYQTILKMVLLHIHLKQYMMRRRGVAILEKLREIRMEMSLKGFAEEDFVDGSRRSGANNELSTLVPSLTGFGVNRDSQQTKAKQNLNYQPLPASFMAESIQNRSREQVSQLHSPQSKRNGNNNINGGNTNIGTNPENNPPATPAPHSGTSDLVALSQATGMNLTIAAPQKQAATTKGKRQNGAAAAAASSSAESDNAQDSLQRSTLDLVPKLLRAFVELESGITVGQQIRLMQQLQEAKLEKLNGKRDSANDGSQAELELERLMDNASLAYEAFTDPLPVTSSLVKTGYRSGRSSLAASPALARRTLAGSTETFLSSPRATPEARAKLSPPPQNEAKHRRTTSQTISNQPTVQSLNTPSMLEFLTLLKDETLLTAQNFVQLRSQLLLWRQTASAFFQRNLESSDRIHELLKEREENQASNAQLRKANAALQATNAQLTAAHATIEKEFGKSESIWQQKRSELEAGQAVELQKLSDKRSKYRHQIRALEVRLGSMLMQEQAAQANNTTAEGFSHADVRSLEKVMDVLNPYATSSLKRTVLAKHGVQIEKWTRSPSTNGDRESHSKKAHGKSRGAGNGDQMERTLPRIWTSHSQRYEEMSGLTSERKPRKQQSNSQALSNSSYTPRGMSSTGMPPVSPSSRALDHSPSVSPHHQPHPPPAHTSSSNAKRFHLHSKSPGPSTQQQTMPPSSSSQGNLLDEEVDADHAAAAEEKEREQSSNMNSAAGSMRSSTTSLPPPSFDERSPYFPTGQDSLEASSDDNDDGNEEDDGELNPIETRDANEDAGGEDEALPLPSVPPQSAAEQAEETNDKEQEVASASEGIAASHDRNQPDVNATATTNESQDVATEN